MTAGIASAKRPLLLLFLLFSVAPVAGDRDVSLPSDYFQRLRKKRAAGGKDPLGKQGKYTVVNDNAASGIKIRPNSRSRSSLLARSFVLASVFWTIRFILPQALRWILRWCRDVTKFKKALNARAKEMRRRRKAKSSRGGEDEATVASGAPSISPSVREIMELGDDGSDEGSSFISAPSFSSIFTMGSYYVNARAQARRRAKTPERREPKSHKSQRPLKSSRRRGHVDDLMINDGDAAPNTFPTYLRLIDENAVSSDATDEEPRHSKRRGGGLSGRTGVADSEDPWLDEASHLPATGDLDYQRGQEHRHGHGPRRKKQVESPLERKLSADAHHGSLEPSAGGRHHRKHHAHGERHGQKHIHHHGHRHHSERS